ncbi:MAG TPA: hypothetical protein DIV86_00670, partial [Alphaproteobacteria bacterium]|nr:hypothetical protein [Alphaproteobacteria bacterium]
MRKIYNFEHLEKRNFPPSVLRGTFGVNVDYLNETNLEVLNYPLVLNIFLNEQKLHSQILDLKEEEAKKNKYTWCLVLCKIRSIRYKW